MSTRTTREMPQKRPQTAASRKKIASLEAILTRLQTKIDRLLDERNGLRAALRAAEVRGRLVPKVRVSDDTKEAPILAPDALPPLPPADAEGYYPAVEFAYAALARTLITRRRKAGLTQVQLAEKAGVRKETVNRLESGRHSPNVRTVDKIDAALKMAGA